MYNAPCGACTAFFPMVFRLRQVYHMMPPLYPDDHVARAIAIGTKVCTLHRLRPQIFLLELLTSCWQTLKLQVSPSSAPRLKHLDIRFYSLDAMFNNSVHVFNSSDAYFNSSATSQSGRTPIFDDRRLARLVGEAQDSVARRYKALGD